MNPKLRCTAFLVVLLFVPSVKLSQAQVVPSAYVRTLSITGGGLGSAFQPDYEGSLVAKSAPNYLFGFGAYTDVHFSRWLELEAEGRWLRFNQFENIHEDNYLLGYEHHFDRQRFFGFTPYAKVLVGYGTMNFEFNDAHGRFTDIAYGGGLDVRTHGRFVLRPVDFEYQQWPNWLNSSLHPYGFSAGIGYRFLGR